MQLTTLQLAKGIEEFEQISLVGHSSSSSIQWTIATALLLLYCRPRSLVVDRAASEVVVNCGYFYSTEKFREYILSLDSASMRRRNISPGGRTSTCNIRWDSEGGIVDMEFPIIYRIREAWKHVDFK